MNGLATEFRYVMRVLARSPGFVLVAVLSLAFGIGANAAVFGTISDLLYDALPVDRPEELAVVYWTREGGPGISNIASSVYRDPASGVSYNSNFSYPLYRELRDAAPDAQLFAFNFVPRVSVAAGDQPAIVGGGLFADGRYFSVLRPGMALGRPTTDADDTPGAPLVVVLSHAFWMSVYGGDPTVIGRALRVNGESAEIVGVSARGFEGLSRGSAFFPLTDVTFPLSAQPRIVPRWGGDGESLLAADGVFWLRLMARVPDRDDLSAVTRDLTQAFRSVPSPANEGDASSSPTLLLAPAAGGPLPVHEDTARPLWILMGVVGAVMLIVCVNVASLMLARGAEREREMAVRRALGCGRAHVLRPALLEGLVISAAGTAGGLVLVLLTRGFLGSLLTTGLGTSAFGAVVVRPALDLRVFGYSIVLCVAATLLFGLLPSLRHASLDPGSALKHRVAGASGPRLTLGRMLIALQIAVSVPLVAGAVLFLQTVRNLSGVELGFDPRGLVMFGIDPSFTSVPRERHAALYRDVLERVRAIPGVRSATLIENPLMSGMTSSNRATIEGREHNLYMNSVGPDFVETMGMRLIAGRMPGPADDPSSAHVGALNERAVRELFDGRSPIGRTMTVGNREVEIVGIVGDSRYDRQRSHVRPTLYDAAFQRGGFAGPNVVLRTDVSPASLEPAIRTAVANVDRDLPVPEIRTQLALIARTSARERVFMQLLIAFGGFALLLASLGLHGVTAYSVSRRTNEIGVRMAIGARPDQVLWLVLRSVGLLAVAGLALGVPAALALGPIVRSLLFGVAPDSVTVIAATGGLTIAIALAAGMRPALRAARLDVVEALRSE